MTTSFNAPVRRQGLQGKPGRSRARRPARPVVLAGTSRRERALPLAIALTAVIVTTTVTDPGTARADLDETPATPAEQASFDGDGLVDLYVAAYASDMLRKEVEAARQDVARGGAAPESLLAAMLPERDSRLLARLARHPDAHDFRRLPGPPYPLLHNTGNGRFEEVADTPLRLFYNTYQAAWSDDDRDDGDPDVYVTNDFAPNQMMRNDGGGQFEDVSGVSGLDHPGDGRSFALFAIERDGRPDLVTDDAGVVRWSDFGVPTVTDLRALAVRR